MSLLKETTSAGFDTASIHRGDMIRVRYATWEEPSNGIVAYVTTEAIRVLYLTATGHVSNFYSIHLSDVLNGLWEVQWSSDFETVNAYAPDTEEPDAEP